MINEIVRKIKLGSIYFEPFKILRRIGEIAYELALPLNIFQLYIVFPIPMLRNYNPNFGHVEESECVDLQHDLSCMK